MKHLILFLIIIACGAFYTCKKPISKLSDNHKALTPITPITKKSTITLNQLIETI